MTASPTTVRTRFAPAPTGYLHLGHVANAIWVWGLARRTGARVLLRIEDHDRVRCRPEYDAALLEDLAWLGFEADEGPVRQSDEDAPYAAALERLRDPVSVYGCDCARSTFERWAGEHGRRWHGPGCPGGCRERGLDGPVLRAALGGGSESWMDLLVGPCSDEVAADGDLPVRDRDGNWTYAFSVVVDDMRQDVDLVVRGRDLLATTPVQIRLARLLGRSATPTYAHHRLVRDADGRKLSKADGATGVRDLRSAGMSPQEVIELAAAAAGRPDSEGIEHGAPGVSHHG
jgi:glutamyl/glutaminyl-tRNA synthetase